MTPNSERPDPLAQVIERLETEMLRRHSELIRFGKLARKMNEESKHD